MLTSPLVPDRPVTQGHQEKRGSETWELALGLFEARHRKRRDRAMGKRRSGVERVLKGQALDPDNISGEAEVDDLSAAIAQLLKTRTAIRPSE
jgi:hypothetical protein